ncbi:MAG: endolytic transglycosylase MltG [Acidobacteria bacterium]|nr:endolytic transglycosylase MltG [Acidobacteriota bacterium]MBV9146511.1 endolytic transglycosylase MltG [Acidobacteriota bacterium]MBV9436682.1 endolytic transglycosylase MltG [Acidobacteriota bacterium]
MRKLFAILVLLLIGFAAWIGFAFLVPAGPSQQTFVDFKTGSSVRTIASGLKNAGIIRSRPAFLLLHLLKSRSLKAGEYAFDHPDSLNDVYNRIARGDTYARVLVVPEGYNIFDIAAAVEHAGIDSQQNFLEQARAQVALVRDLDPQAPTLEGYLFPDTYRVPRKDRAADVVAAMVRKFHQQAHAIGLNSDLHKIVTMASIVEKETAVPDERPVVAGVFYNRLTQRMALDTDPSVIYAALLANRYRGTIYASDLQFSSPYNTYRHAGLPPGPICNPGKDALAAAMHPAQTEYLYFVSDNQGHHRFSRTLEEHQRNVAEYRRATSGMAQ